MNLKYHLLFNKTFLSPDGRGLRDQIYALWRQQWEKIYSEQGSLHSPTADDFVRHDLFSALVSEQRVVAFGAHTLLDFHDAATYDRDYFTMVGRENSAVLQSWGVNRVVTWESLIVRPEFRRNVWEMPLGRLLIRINSYLFGLTSADAMIAVARKDNGVSANLTTMGYRMVEADRDCRGFLCDVRALERGAHLLPIFDKTEPDAKNLWQERIEHRGVEFVPVDQEIRRNVA